MRERDTREGRRIDVGCKATAVGWRSAVWSHSHRSLQQTLQGHLNHQQQTPKKKGHGSEHALAKIHSEIYTRLLYYLF